MEKDILNSHEAAAFLGISLSCLYKINMNRKIPFLKPNNKLIYYKKTDLEEFLESNRIASKKELENQIIDNLKSNHGR
ncbi:MAG: helix-turn-helix domain-containing protein [Chitinophagales bacterium]|jgi:predicted site-specific integrase-resolvase